MDNNITRTIYGANVQDNLFLGTVQEYQAFTTLNEYLNIQKDNLPNVGDRPALGCYVWGNKGHRLITGEQGIPLNDPLKHMTTDSGLFGQLPFVLRELTNDLTATQRARYCLRRIEERNGINYIAYYGRRLDKTNWKVINYYTQVQDGGSTTTPFVPSQSNLTPTPVQLSNTGTNLINADYVSAKARVELVLDEADVNDMINVAKVIFKDERYAIISEIGMCTNVDRNISAAGGTGGSFQYMEAIGVQIASHIATYQSLPQNNTGVKIALNTGMNEPLFALSVTDGGSTGGGVVTP